MQVFQSSFKMDDNPNSFDILRTDNTDFEIKV